MDLLDTDCPRLDTDQLQNTYFGLRHGTSRANETGIIISDPLAGIDAYGLSEQGVLEVENSIIEATRNGWVTDKTVIYTSDFRRTLETATIASQMLHTRPPIVSLYLRERRFRDFDGGPDDAYNRVWERDAIDPNHHDFRCESVHDVLERTVLFVLEMERRYYDSTILMVSHGDPLQILLTAFCGIPPNKHRELIPFARGEIRNFTPTFHT